MRGEPLLGDWRPEPKLRVAGREVPRAAVPAVDTHNHLGRWLKPDGGWAVPDPAALVAQMDECNVAAVVNLDGRWGDELEANLDRFDRAHPGRFATFCHVDWSPLSISDATDDLVRSLERSARAGAVGLKVWKDVGLEVRDHGSELVLPDDPRLGPVWDAAGALGLPVMIHTGDPAAFFDPVDERNERLLELLAYPELRHRRPGAPTFERLIASLESTVAAHPRTRFIGAHVGCHAEDLGWVDRMLATYANFFVDTAGRVAELGRQPRAARRLILDHADRVLWGSDAYPPTAAAWGTNFRFLETDDEHFAYSDDPIPPQGRWQVSALDLPAEVLRPVYRDNALRLLPRLAEATGGGP